MQPTEEFRGVLQANGLVVDQVIADGSLHRCGTEGKERGTDGAYVFYPDSPPSGWWQNHRTGASDTWTTTAAMTAEEQARLKARMERDRQAREAQRATKQAEAKKRAQEMLSTLPPCPGSHPYLTAKGVSPREDMRLLSEKILIVPVLGDDGKAMSLQQIAEDGQKRFLTGGQVKGGFYPIKGDDGPLCVCEGVATGLSINAATGHTVLCAFNAGNLEAVAGMARKRYPQRPIILAGDDDILTKGNPGRTKATEAARAVGGKAVFPSFRDSTGRTDFNDMHQEQGLEAVTTAFVEAMSKEEPKCREKPKGIVAYDIESFLTLDIPEREMIIDPVIPGQGLAMLYGPRGGGKTFLAMTLACSVAVGCKALHGWESPKPHRVLYVDGEMPAKTMQERLVKILAGLPGDMPGKEYLSVITPDLQPEFLPSLAQNFGQSCIDSHLEGVSLVVLDNLSTLCSHGEENKAESWVPIQEWLLKLRRRGLSVLLIHHAGKGGQQRGTSKREDILDTVIALRHPHDYEPDQGARFEIHLEKARGIVGDAAKPFCAQLFTNPDGSLSWRTSDLEDSRMEAVRKCLDEKMTVREIADELGISRSAAGRLKKKVER